MNKDVELTLEDQAYQTKLPMSLLYAFAMVESSGKWGATRHEPKYQWLVDVTTGEPFRKLKPNEIDAKLPPVDFPGLDGVTTPAEEWEGQRTSFGLLQIMGAVARELGYRGPFEDLKHIEGARWAAKHLKNLHGRHFEKAGIEGVIAAYNCGQPKPEQVPTYVSRVLEQIEIFKSRYGA